MEAAIVQRETICLVGMSFFGDPFGASAGWTEENEIGRLWTRFLRYLEAHAWDLPGLVNAGQMYEVHVGHPETRQTGEQEVFVGLEVSETGEAPVELVVKVLPPCTYAVFTLQGEEITADWARLIYAGWMPGSGWEGRGDWGFQLYDARFKGVSEIAASTLDVYVPVRPSGSPAAGPGAAQG